MKASAWAASGLLCTPSLGLFLCHGCEVSTATTSGPCFEAELSQAITRKSFGDLDSKNLALLADVNLASSVHVPPYQQEHL